MLAQVGWRGRLVASHRRFPKVVVIGTGYWGRNLVRNFSELGALHGVCDRREDTRNEIAKTFPATRVFADADAVFADEAIEAVAIATPAATHGDLTSRALHAGKHVFVEKPLCLDLGEASRLRDEAERKGLTLMVGHLLLYHPAFITLKAAVKARRLGTLRYIYSNRLSLGKIRREENALWSFAPHDISMILQLTGSLPVSVAASGGCYLARSIADTTLTQLAFSNGVQAHIFVSWLHPYKDQKLVVVGDKGMAVFNDAMSGAKKLLLYAHQAAWDGDLPLIEKAEAVPLPYVPEEPLRRECQVFLDAVIGLSSPPSKADEGIRVLQVLEACQRAIESGERVFLPTLSMAEKTMQHV